ncbi:MAG: hypothetical protein J7J51_05260 [Candidatus Omnitrophica bacterium]|nr:hypothetical protein [Candidatus Omnitrophota bacterium]
MAFGSKISEPVGVKVDVDNVGLAKDATVQDLAKDTTVQELIKQNVLEITETLTSPPENFIYDKSIVFDATNGAKLTGQSQQIVFKDNIMTFDIKADMMQDSIITGEGCYICAFIDRDNYIMVRIYGDGTSLYFKVIKKVGGTVTELYSTSISVNTFYTVQLIGYNNSAGFYFNVYLNGTKVFNGYEATFTNAKFSLYASATLANGYIKNVTLRCFK